MNVAQTNPAINEAWGHIRVLSGDEQARALAEAREKHRMDLDAYIDDARYEGEQIGLQKGRIEVARNLLQDNMPVASVSKATGLSLAEIERLAADLS